MDPATEPIPRSTSPLKPPRKRKRIVISCTECHRRKQKCDRGSPCANCTARNKQSLCHYENESARKAQLLEENKNGASDEDAAFRAAKGPASNIPGEAQVSAIGYTNSSGNNNTTLGILKKIESQGQDADNALFAVLGSNSTGVSGLKEKYKSCIRQLPSKQHIELLLVTYFRESNCQYYPLDEAIFRDQLQSWHSLPFTMLNKGPLELSPDMQFFPALLFQILATALQFQPTEHDPIFDSLKYAAGMTLDDLAGDYSELGIQILHLLGKRRTNLLTVQAGYLRTQYLKTCGMVPESWHALSQTIRDAQEIGLHKDAVDERTRKPNEKAPDVLEMLWMQQLRRRMWLILTLWDVHMAIVLGRPTTVDNRDVRPPFPLDTPLLKNHKEEAPMLRRDTDPPTPLTKLLWIAEVCAPLYDIHTLEREDPHQNNFARVEKMHKLIEQISLHTPPFFRAENPDTTFDSLPECHWLVSTRYYLQSSAAFTIMALHRPYIFTNSTSRTAALKAALDVLRAQRSMFNIASAIQHKLFTLVLNTFDAVVLVAAIFILHPFENPDDLDDTLRHFQWGIERFETMSARNAMARSALGVLKAIYVRLRKALSQPVKNPPAKSHILTAPPSEVSKVSPQSQSVPSPQSVSQASLVGTESSPANSSSTHATSYHTNNAISTSSNSSITQSPPNTQTSNQAYNMPSISNMTAPTNMVSSWEAYPSNMPIPQSFDYASIQPLHPMHDLIYNDLGGTVGNYDFSTANENNLPQNDGNWGFAGDFTTDSFWGFMNQFTV